MPSFVFATTCNKPRLRDPTRAIKVMRQFWFDWDFAVGVEQDGNGESRLTIDGEGWPAAWHNPADCHPGDFEPDFDTDGIADFESFLEMIGPCLDELLIVQAIGTVQGQFPLLANEWSISPGSKFVHRRELFTGDDACAGDKSNAALQLSPI